MRLELVRDWMTRDVITVNVDASIADGAQLMTKHNIRRLPVVDADGQLAGIVTYGDVRGARPSSAASLNLWELNYLLTQKTVEDIMTPEPLSVPPDATVGEAAQIMLTNQVSGLPVVEADGELVGILTESDIFRMVVHDWQRTREEGESKPYAYYGK